MKLVITAPALCQPSYGWFVKEAEAYFDVVVTASGGKEGLMAVWEDADAVIAGSEPYDAELIAKAPETLKVISRHGVGCDAIDIAAASARGIRVCRAAGGNAASVAETVLGMMLNLARNLNEQDRLVRTGAWVRKPGHELGGRKAGIAGYGAAGKQVAVCCRAFGMEVLAFDPYKDPEQMRKEDVCPVTWEELLKESDVITLHMPASPDGKPVMDQAAIAAMKKGSYLINCARGSLVDEDALYEALAGGHLAGAGLDVYRTEPLRESRLFTLDNVILTPHQAGNADEAVSRMGRMALENAAAVLRQDAAIENAVN